MSNPRTILVALLLAIGIVGIHQVSKKMPDSTSISRYSKKIRKLSHWRGKYAPDFDLKLLDGRTFRLADAVGNKIVALNFFATWCRPCREEIPELSRYALTHRDEPFILLGINVDEEEAYVTDFVRKYEIAFPVGIDVGGHIRKKYGVDSLPTTVLIDPQGTLILYETGAVSNADVLFEHVLSPLLPVVREGKGISREDYIAGQKNESYRGLLTPRGPVLHGRAAKIAERVYCPCGQGRQLAMCSCVVARRMKKDLTQAVREQKDDKTIIEELSRKYSVVKK